MRQGTILVFDKTERLHYNILNKRTVGQRTLGRRQISLQKVAPYFTRARALLFACKKHNKSYDSAKHHYKLK